MIFVARALSCRLLRNWPAAAWLAAWSWMPCCVVAAPAVFYATDPVGPDQTVVVVGEGFHPSAKAGVTRLPDGEPGNPPSGVDSRTAPAASGLVDAEVLQAGPQCVKFVVPSSLPVGLYAWQIKLPDGASTAGMLNRPVIWWTQGDNGPEASPGGWVRAFGKNLAGQCRSPDTLGVTAGSSSRAENAVGQAKHGPILRLTGNGRSVRLECRGTPWDQEARIPADLLEGAYQLSAHSGFGGAAGWSAPVSVRVARSQPWPLRTFNVAELGADPTGQSDATAAVEAVLAQAEENHGGVVYFPRGRYRLSSGLKIPRFTVLRGQRPDMTCLFWPEMERVPDALVQGANSFGLEDLTLYTNRYKHVVAGDLGATADAGNVFLRRVRVRASLYRGHPTPEEVHQQFQQALKSSTGGGDTVRLGGPNVEITDCDLYGAGRVLFLSRARGGRVAGNRLWNGRWGWYCISGSDGLIFENNELAGADLMSTGGGLNCLDGSNYSQNIFFAHNRMGMTHGWDREIMTTDAGGEAYRGSATADGAHLTLAEDPLPRWKNRDWQGAGVFILAGRGAGQWRRAVRAEGRVVELDRPWDIPPDAQSYLSISMFQGRYLVLDNEFSDCGAVQFYGTSIECVMAGNRGTRMQGFRGMGLDYHGLQPSWYCLFLNNRIREGNYYHWTSATQALLQVLGSPGPRFQDAINCGAVVRGNVLENNAQLDVRGAVRDAVVESNSVAHADQGLFVSQSCTGVLVRNNRFDDVTNPQVDEPTLRRLAQQRMKAFLGRREPVAVWTFDRQEGPRFADSSGNGFHAVATVKGVQSSKGHFGQAVHLDGAGWLRVEEPAVFNSPDLTVSFWVQPEKITGRYGLVAKRFAGCGAPWVLSQTGDRIGFEATEEDGGRWSFNFLSPGVLKAGQWTHVAAVAQQGQGVILYADGREVARKAHTGIRAGNSEPLVIGREAWGGDPASTKQVGLLSGLIDELKIWTRALGPEEIQAEFARTEKESQGNGAGVK